MNVVSTNGGEGRFYDDLSYSTPLFERLPNNHADEGQSELRECKAFLELQQRKIQELERINTDLEKRLEQQARERMKIEKEVAESKRVWEAKYVMLEKERDIWKAKTEKEQLHVQKLREQVRRLERELHGFLQKKYDFMASKGGKGGPPAAPQPTTGATSTAQGPIRAPTPSSAGGLGRGMETVPLNPKNFNPEAVREKQVIQSLCEFFGF